MWTKTFLHSINSHNISVDLINLSLVGERKNNLTASRNFNDEYHRTKRIFRQLKSCLSINDYNIAHLNTACGSFGIIRDYIILKKIKKRRIPIIVQYHCDVEMMICNKIQLFFLSKIAKAADLNIVLNQNSRNFIEHFSPRNVKIIPNFIDASFIYENKEIKDRITMAFFSGRVSVEKGAKEIFDVAKHFKDIEFLLAGYVSEEINSWNIPDNIILLGMIDKQSICNYLDDCDFYLFPSHFEGFSIALLEAMARGVPIIASDVGANNEMIENKGGKIIRISEISELIEAIDSIKDPYIRQKMSIWNINKVKKYYSSDIVCKNIIKLYKEICKI